MELYVYAQEDGSITGFSEFQPSGYNFPKLEISDEDIENFRANFFKYRYLNGELVKPQEQASKEDYEKVQQQLTTQQQISAKAIQEVAKLGASINELQVQIQEIKKSNDQSTTSSQKPVDSQSQSQSVSESGSNSESNSNAESGVTK